MTTLLAAVGLSEKVRKEADGTWTEVIELRRLTGRERDERESEERLEKAYGL